MGLETGHGSPEDLGDASPNRLDGFLQRLRRDARVASRVRWMWRCALLRRDMPAGTLESTQGGMQGEAVCGQPIRRRAYGTGAIADVGSNTAGP